MGLASINDCVGAEFCNVDAEFGIFVGPYRYPRSEYFSLTGRLNLMLIWQNPDLYLVIIRNARVVIGQNLYLLGQIKNSVQDVFAFAAELKA